MNIVDRGHGVPLVLIPGLQGRWEYLQPAIDVLAQSFRTITFALLGRRAGGPQARVDDLVDQVSAALDRSNLERAVICGISFGGLVAVRFAARHPERTIALVLASTPGPDFRLSSRHLLYARAPWLFGPLFLIETPRRLQEELKVAIPRLLERLRFGWRQAKTLITAPLSMTAMAARARLIVAANPAADCARVAAPTLIITGEPSLDRVVRVNSTLAYVALIRGARSAVLTGTGHVGYLTRPERFAALIREFLARSGVLTHDAA